MSIAFASFLPHEYIMQCMETIGSVKAFHDTLVRDKVSLPCPDTWCFHVYPDTFDRVFHYALMVEKHLKIALVEQGASITMAREPMIGVWHIDLSMAVERLGWWLLFMTVDIRLSIKKHGKIELKFDAAVEVLPEWERERVTRKK